MSETINIADPPEALRDSVDTAIAVARTYATITLPEQRRAVGGDIQSAKGVLNEIEAERVKITGPLNQAFKATNALFKRMSEPLENAVRDMKRAALAYDTEEDRKKAAAVREAARIADAERQRLEGMARQALKTGHNEESAALAAQAQMIAPVPVAVETVKVEGEAHVELWRAEITSFRALCFAVGQGAVTFDPEDELAIAARFTSVLNKRARALKSALDIPGVRAVSERILKSRAA